MVNDLNIPLGELAEFENSFDPQNLVESKIPVSVMGYGEISTVLDIALNEERSLAYKRMPLFHSQAEVEQYRELYEEYVKLLDERIGIAVVPSKLVTVTNAEIPSCLLVLFPLRKHRPRLVRFLLPP